MVRLRSFMWYRRRVDEVDEADDANDINEECGENELEALGEERVLLDEHALTEDPDAVESEDREGAGEEATEDEATRETIALNFASRRRRRSFSMRSS